jgi:hypothetical protein
MADRLNVTELDFDSIKTSLRTFLRQQTEFQDYDFEGSGLSVLLDILAYNTHYNAYYLNMIANEAFLDSASLRNSVVSHAKRVGYTPRSVRAPRAIVTVNVATSSANAGSLTIPSGYSFSSSQLDGVSYKFVTIESNTTTTKVANNFIFTNVPIYQGQLASYSYTNSISSNPKQTFTIPDANIDTTTLKVSVTQSSSNTETIVYELSTNALTVDSTSEVYYLQEGKGGEYEIYFGDDVLGKKVPDGGIISVEYLITDSSASNKANSFVSSVSIGGFSTIFVNSIQAAAGGTQRESVDSIKFAAPLSLLSQNRAVTKNDYIKLILQNYPSFEAVNVWGGEENDPPVYGKVFISAKPKLGFEVSDTEKEYIRNTILKPISVLTITPEIVDIDYNYLKIEANVFYNKSKMSLNDSELKAALRTVIQNYTDTNLNQFNSYFKFSGLETTIDDFNRAIISNEVTLFVAKKFRPDLINSDNYILDYGFELNRGTTNDNFYSSPDFTMRDEDGISRQCFFEEIPSSFTGLESVTVNNPGFGYTSTPTVTIIGDGTGAVATATIVNSKLSKITVTNPGVGYTTAAVQITGGSGTSGSGLAVLEGRYGKLRISYFKADEISSQSTKVVLNANKNSGIIGEIDYSLGKITITAFNPIAVNNDFGDISVHIKPKVSIIQSKLNKMLVLDSDDPTSVIVKTVLT